MKKIILDTNFLLIPSQFKVDIFSEIDRIMLEKYNLFIIDRSIYELKKIISDKNQKQKDKRAAKLALQLIEAKNIKKIKTPESQQDLIVDDIIVDITDDPGLYIVATQDIDLKKRLKLKKIGLITLRAKKKLILA